MPSRQWPQCQDEGRQLIYYLDSARWYVSTEQNRVRMDRRTPQCQDEGRQLRYGHVEATHI